MIKIYQSFLINNKAVFAISIDPQGAVKLIIADRKHG